MAVINNIRLEYKADISLVVLSQDWHCSDHISFASQHKGSSPVIQLLYDKSGSLCDENNNCTEVAYNLTQHLWPDHCVINTPSANFSLSLTQESSDIVIRKGYNCKVDSYSAFYDNVGFRHTELHDKLQEAGIDALIITGLARDYCVYYTAMDAKKLGYETYVATRPVTKITGDSAVADMKIKGIQIIESSDVAGVIAQLTSDAKHLHSPFILMISIILCFIKVNMYLHYVKKQLEEFYKKNTRYVVGVNMYLPYVKKQLEEFYKEEHNMCHPHNPIFQQKALPHEDDTPYWIHDADIGHGKIRYINKEEKHFWKELIRQYLYPLQSDAQQQKQMQTDLIQLRNKASLMFFVLNALHVFIIIIFSLQYSNAISSAGLTIPLPCKDTEGKDLSLEPISMCFMAVFGIALLIQFISMIFHRLGTFLHIMASTEVNCMRPNQNEVASMDISSKEQLVKEMQRFEDDEDAHSISTIGSDGEKDSSVTMDD
ncbi:unnamed protein product [Mytilus coruscus]|uniref:nicotinamidase n=1 Tax=Mytilus coruscus TaxID=42192 RepID=A0A6J8AEK5_MYTCO|nr:unnamed protein product [Mytilus coruscus]